MNQKYLEKLEFNKVLEILKSHARTYLGKEKCLRLRPYKNVSFELDQTFEALNMIYKNGSLPLR